MRKRSTKKRGLARENREGPHYRALAVGAGAAMLLIVMCAVPFFLWGNPYPEGVVPYWVWGSACATVVVGLAAFMPAPVFRDLPRRSAEALVRPSPVVFALMAAGTAFALSLAFAVYAFRRTPTTSDEVAQLWHARILLTGRLSLSPDPNPEFFALENIIDVGRWYSQFPIGGPLVLAVGALFGVPWVVNPVLAAITVVAAYWFTRNAFGELQGRASTALFAVTPMVLFMAGTWMNHVPVLCLAMITLGALTEWERASGGRALVWAAVIGVSLGAMATIRPLDAIIVALPVGLFQLWTIRRGWKRTGEIVLQIALGAFATTPLLYANAATTGSPLRFGYEVMWGAGHQLGFRVDPYGNVHTVGRALEYAITYVSELNIFLMAWPVPSLLIVIVALFALAHVTRWDVLLLALFFTQVAAYASYSLVGEFLGPRFLYTALPTLIILIARAPFLIGARFGQPWRRAALTFTLASVATAWLVPGLRYNVWGLAQQARGTRRALKVDIAGAVYEANIHRALVFVREPLGSRLLRRLWGTGVSRSEAAQLIDSRDTCSLLTALRLAETDTVASPTMKAAAIGKTAELFTPNDQATNVGHPNVQLSSLASLTPECKVEIQGDAGMTGLSFGSALPLEPITDGRIDGDVIYVADLGERNEVLRSRFSDRGWYRLTATRTENGELAVRIVPY